MSVPSGIAPVALIFKLNNGLVARSLDGLTDEDVWRRPAGGNPIGWLLGHLTETRATLLAELEQPMSIPWPAAFARGAPLLDARSYPARTAIEGAWTETHGRLRDAFDQLTEARLTEASKGLPLPGAKTLAERLAFLAFHESYHVGQMGYVRRLLGGSPVAG
jgi:uncharacterized damage-inducible protein DinB